MALGTLLWCFWLNQQAQLPTIPNTWLWGASLLLLCANFTVTRIQCLKKSIKLVISTTLKIILGVCAIAAWQLPTIEKALQDRLPIACEGIPLDIKGQLVALPQMQDNQLRLVIKTDETSRLHVCGKLPSQLSLAWKQSAEPWRPEVGEHWQFTAQLKRTIAPLNFGGFEIERHWLANHIGATGFIVPPPRAASPKQIWPAPSSINTWFHLQQWSIGIEQRRSQIAKHIQNSLPKKQFGLEGVITGLSIGDQKNITPNQWQVLSATGTSHLVSISGMHVTLLAAAMGWLVHRLWSYSTQLIRLLNPKKAACLVSLPLAFLYAALAGWGIPAQRTVWMLLGCTSAALLSMRSRQLDILALAILITIFCDPWAATSAGFLLSFGAVGIFLYSSLGRKQHQPKPFLKLYSVLKSQWVVFVGLTPLTIALFGQQSWAGPVANAIALPWVSFVVTPLSLIGGLLHNTTLLQWAHSTLSILWWLLTKISQWSWAIQPIAQVPWVVSAANLLGVLLCLAPHGVPSRYIGMLLISLPFWWQPERPKSGEFWFDMLDIGQGNAIVIRTQHHSLLVDTGPARSETSDSGRQVIVPWLWRTGHRKLDAMLISHADNDHAGGAQTVLQQLQTHTLYANPPSPEGMWPKTQNTQPCTQGTRWEWDSVQFEIIFPTPQQLQPEIADNEKSCVLKIQGKYGSALLPGDIGVAQEQWLLKHRSSAKLQADILVVPHHGSNTSSSMAWVHAVNPRYALFQVGYRNRYHHPAPQVWARYQQSQKLRTDQSGAIQIQSKQNGFELSTAKHNQKRYWHTVLSAHQEASQ